MTETLKLEQVIEDHASVQVRNSIDQSTVKRYMVDYQNLPPVEVYAVAEGEGVKYYLVDGFTRIAAARQLKYSEIECEVVVGTLKEARVAAALANMRHGQPLKADERDRAIIQIKRNTSRLSLRDIAKLAGCSYQTVDNALKVEIVSRQVGEEIATAMNPSTLRAVAEAKSVENRKLVADAASKNGWTAQQTAATAKAINTATTVAEREKLLEDKPSPVVGPSGVARRVNVDNVVKSIVDGIKTLTDVEPFIVAVAFGADGIDEAMAVLDNAAVGLALLVRALGEQDLTPIEPVGDDEDEDEGDELTEDFEA